MQGWTGEQITGVLAVAETVAKLPVGQVLESAQVCDRVIRYGVEQVEHAVPFGQTWQEGMQD